MIKAMATSASSLAPADLEIRITVRENTGGWALGFELTSQPLELFNVRIEGPRIRRPDAFRDRLFKNLERLHGGRDWRSAGISPPEVARGLATLGQELYDELFPAQLKSEYRRSLRRAETWLLISDEPWIPWEMLKPYDDAGEPLDDDFLALRFQLTRWLAGGRAPIDGSSVARLAGIEAGTVDGYPELGRAAAELRFLRRLARKHGIEDESLSEATYPDVLQLMATQNLDLLHFIGHGEHDPEDPETSAFILQDGRALSPRDLHSVRRRLRENRPVVFLNACEMGRQGWSPTRLGGWARHWVHDFGCRAFIAPQWTVDDHAAHLFATEFYSALEGGETFGKAALRARQALPDNSPARLAGAVYAHPNARLALGNTPPPEPRTRVGGVRRAAGREATLRSQPVDGSSTSCGEIGPVSGNTSIKDESMSSQIGTSTLSVIFAMIVIVATIGVAIYIQTPSDFQYYFFRIILALAAAGVAASIPNLATIKMGTTATVGGAAVVFAVIYFFNPVGLVVDTPPEISFKSIHLERTIEEAQGWVVDTDPIRISWLASGLREDVHVLLENVRTTQKSEALRVSSAEGEVVFTPDQYRSILATRQYTETNKVRAVIQTETNTFYSREFDLHVGITIILFGMAPGPIMAAATVDDSTEALSFYECRIDIVGWLNDGQQTPFFVPVDLRNDPVTEVQLDRVGDIDWRSLGIVYQGPEDDRVVRTAVMVNLSDLSQ